MSCVPLGLELWALCRITLSYLLKRTGILFLGRYTMLYATYGVSFVIRLQDRLGTVHKVYITLFLTNFYLLPPCHILSHISEPPKVRHTSRNTPKILMIARLQYRLILLNFVSSTLSN